MNRAVVFERNLTGSYMKIESLHDGTFDEKLLLEKKMQGILPLDKCMVNGRGQFWIPITGMQALDTYLDVRSAGIDFIEQLIISITGQIELLEKNLVNINCLVLDEAMIFVENQNQTFSFVVLPDQETPLADQFRSLMEYLLTKINHQDKDAVQSGYQLYEQTLNEGYSIKEIRESIVKKRVDAIDDQKTAGIQMLYEAEERSEEDYMKEMMEEYGGGLSSIGAKLRNRRKYSGPDKTERSVGERERSTDKWERSTDEWDRSIGENERDSDWKERSTRKIERVAGKEKVPGKENASGMERAVGKETTAGKERVAREKESSTGKRSFLAWLKALFPFGNREEEDEEDRDIFLTPDIPYEEEAVPEVHPTVFLGNWQAHPEGVLLYEGNEDFHTVRIKDPVNLIGQGSDVDISLKKDTVSHFHARISKQDDEYYIEDLNSTNGTYINGEALAYKEKKKLKMNDLVRFADVRFRFV